MIPFQIWSVELFFSLLFTVYGLFGRDRNNYTDLMALIAGTIFWVISAITIRVGVICEDSYVYSAGYLMWIFLIIGIVVGIIAFVKVLDLVRERKNRKYTDTSFMGLE